MRVTKKFIQQLAAEYAPDRPVQFNRARIMDSRIWMHKGGKIQLSPATNVASLLAAVHELGHACRHTERELRQRGYFGSYPGEPEWDLPEAEAWQYAFAILQEQDIPVTRYMLRVAMMAWSGMRPYIPQVARVLERHYVGKSTVNWI